jgi:predicted PurR-regulated permease PerM
MAHPSTPASSGHGGSGTAASGRWDVRPMVILAAVVAVMYLARAVLIPLAFAVVLSLIWTPAVEWLQRMHFGRWLAVLIVVIGSLLVAGAIGWVIFNQLIAVVNQLPDYQQNIDRKIAALRIPTKGALGQAAERVTQLGKELAAAPTVDPTAHPEPDRLHPSSRSQPPGPVPVQVVEKPANILEYLSELVRPFAGPLGTFGIVLIFSMFLLIERQDVRNRFLRLVGLGQLNVVTQALDDATQRVSRYLLLQFAVNAGFGLLIGIGLYSIGLPFAALWGAVAALLRIVPYLGTLLAGTLPLVLSIAVFDSWMQPMLVLVLIVSLEIVVANWVEPLLYSAHTGVSSLAILVTTVFWAIVWGPAGLILSTPLTVCVAVLGRHVPQLSFLHVLLGDEPVLAADALVYQRLLAMDQVEAHDIADAFLKQNSLLELYDRVFVPALTLAEQDRHKGALDLTRERFVFLSVTEMIAEFSDYEARPSTKSQVVVLPVPEVAPEAGSEVVVEGFKGRALCIPASDEADEITGAMLAQILERHDISSIGFPLEAGIYETLVLLEPQPEDVICLSALPPFAFAQARNVARKLRLKFPRTKLVIGVWGFSGDVKKAQDRFEEPRPDRILVSIADAVDYFKEWGKLPNDAAGDGKDVLGGSDGIGTKVWATVEEKRS